MMKKQIVALVIAFVGLTFWLATPLIVQAEDDVMFLGKKGARWDFNVRWSSGGTGTLTIVNEGNTGGMGANSTTVSWTFKSAAGMVSRLEFYYDRSSDGLVIVGNKAYSGSRLVSSERLEPPMLALKLPLKDEQWEYRGFKISNKGQREGYTSTNRIRSAQIQTPAGTFDAFELQGQESTGSRVAEYWVKDIGLVKIVQTTSGNTMSAELVSYSPSGETPQMVAQAGPSSSVKETDAGRRTPFDRATIAEGTQVFLRHESWACLTAELVTEAYALEKRGGGGLMGAFYSKDRQAVDRMESILEQGQCMKIFQAKGIVVARTNETTQVKGDIAGMTGVRSNVTVWIPTSSLTACKGLLCE